MQQPDRLRAQKAQQVVKCGGRNEGGGEVKEGKNLKSEGARRGTRNRNKTKRSQRVQAQTCQTWITGTRWDAWEGGTWQVLPWAGAAWGLGQSSRPWQVQESLPRSLSSCQPGAFDFDALVYLYVVTWGFSGSASSATSIRSWSC